MGPTWVALKMVNSKVPDLGFFIELKLELHFSKLKLVWPSSPIR